MSNNYTIDTPDGPKRFVPYEDWRVLKLAAIEACQDMGCYCEGEDGAEADMEDPDREKCVMCKLSDAINSANDGGTEHG